MVGIGTTLSMIGITLSAVLIPMIYLSINGTSDPDGIIDGLLRLTWFMPAVWLLGVGFESGWKSGKFKGIFRLHVPMLVFLCVISFVILGWSNRDREVVGEKLSETRYEKLRRKRSEEEVVQVTFPVLGRMGQWAHGSMPNHPFRFNRE